VRKKLNVPGEASLLGKGVSYCATCDGGLFQDKVVAVIGGSNAALTAALLLSEYSDKVYLIYRKDKFFRAEPSWVDLVENNNKIKILFNEEIIKINGKEKVQSIDLKSGKILDLDGVFIEIGSLPKIDFISNFKIKLDEKGYVLVDKNQKTNEKGVYAAGDITNNALKQIITAGAEGAIAAYNIYQEIKKDSQE
ncbi:MAG TPA: FAD-dependent oxidoreductase, partial [Candidatus Nanoarchaeia archaeon]|nr:FAD-dependent oxidoreductase [Candidatus Nanoarchaeia archaeon]